jgi:hypothetical protein
MRHIGTIIVCAMCLSVSDWAGPDGHGAIKAQSGPSAVGLLRGAELARSQHKRYRSTINIRRGSDESRAVLEVDDRKFRVEYVNRHGDQKVTVRGGQEENITVTIMANGK